MISRLFSKLYATLTFLSWMTLRACVCVSLASDFSETVEVIIVKFEMVTLTVSDMRMRHVLIILNLIFIQGHTGFNHENNKCLIISETIQAMPLKFAVIL